MSQHTSTTQTERNAAIRAETARWMAETLATLKSDAKRAESEKNKFLGKNR